MNMEREMARRLVAAYEASPEWQAFLAEGERRILYGDPTMQQPGILNAGG